MPHHIAFLLTALSDIWTGYFIFAYLSGAASIRPTRELILLFLISLLLYAGGMSLKRTPKSFLLGTSLCLGSLFIAKTTSLATVGFTTAIIILWIAYNFYTKDLLLLGGFNLGLIRAFMFLLGTTSFSNTNLVKPYITFPLVPFTYTFAISLLNYQAYSHLSSNPANVANVKKPSKPYLLFLMIILPGAVMWPIWLVRSKTKAIWLNLILVIYFLVRLWQMLPSEPTGARSPSRRYLQDFSRGAILGIFPLEASLLFGFDLIVPGLIMLGTWFVCVGLTKITS